MFKKIISLTMTALIVCGLFVMPAYVNASESVEIIVLHDEQMNEQVDSVWQPACDRVDSYNMTLITKRSQETFDFAQTQGKRFTKANAGSNYVTYNVDGLDFDTLTFVMANGKEPMVLSGTVKIKVAYSNDKQSGFTDLAAVTPVTSTEVSNSSYKWTYTFRNIPDCKYIKIYDTEAMDYGSCDLVDLKLTRNVVEGTSIDNGIEFVEFHDDMNPSAIPNRMLECTAGNAGTASAARFGYLYYRSFAKDSVSNHIIYNVEGLDVNTLKVVFTNGSKLNANSAEDISIEYSTDNVTYTKFPIVQTVYSDTQENSQWLNTFIIRDVPECKYIRISDSTSHNFGSLQLRDVKMSRIYGETYSYVATATTFASDSIAQSSSNMSFINTPGEKALAGYDYRMTFPKTSDTSNAAGEMIWKADGIDFNQIRLMFLGASSPKVQKIEVAYSENGTSWTKYTDSTDDTTMSKPTLWSEATSNQSIQLYTWIINDITDDWKYIKISGPAVSSSSFYFTELQLRNNKNEVKVTETCKSDLTDSTYVAGSVVTGTVTVENYTGYVGSTANIMVLYKEKSLVSVALNKTYNFTDDYQENTDTLTLTLPEDYTTDGGYQLKVFAWDSLEKMVPLFPVK